MTDGCRSVSPPPLALLASLCLSRRLHSSCFAASVDVCLLQKYVVWRDAVHRGERAMKPRLVLLAVGGPHTASLAKHSLDGMSTVRVCHCIGARPVVPSTLLACWSNRQYRDTRCSGLCALWCVSRRLDRALPLTTCYCYYCCLIWLLIIRAVHVYPSSRCCLQQQRVVAQDCCWS